MKYWIIGIVIVALIVASYWAGTRQKDKNEVTETPTASVSDTVSPTYTNSPTNTPVVTPTWTPTATSTPSGWHPSGTVGNRVGDYAPDFKLQDSHGNYFTMSNYLGKQNIRLVFWTSNCQACVDLLQSGDVLTFGINRKESTGVVQSYAGRESNTLKLLMDPSDTIFRLHNGNSMPFVVNIDANGIIR